MTRAELEADFAKAGLVLVHRPGDRHGDCWAVMVANHYAANPHARPAFATVSLRHVTGWWRWKAGCWAMRMTLMAMVRSHFSEACSDDIDNAIGWFSPVWVPGREVLPGNVRMYDDERASAVPACIRQLALAVDDFATGINADGTFRKDGLKGRGWRRAAIDLWCHAWEGGNKPGLDANPDVVDVLRALQSDRLHALPGAQGRPRRGGRL